MNIDRYNYEEYFLLYIDNELGAEDRAAVEAFAQQHPDLAEELAMLQQSVFRPGEEALPVFEDKAALLKPESSINDINCEEYFVQYGDDELTNQQKALVEAFVYKNPQYQADFELIQQARLSPDPLLVFPDKQSLYRSERDRKVFPLRRWQFAAAAASLLAVGILGWFTLLKKDGDTTQLAGVPAKPDTSLPANGTQHPSGPASDEARAPELPLPDNTGTIASQQDQPQPAATPNSNPQTIHPAAPSLAATKNQASPVTTDNKSQYAINSTGNEIKNNAAQQPARQTLVPTDPATGKGLASSQKKSEQNSNLPLPSPVTPSVAVAAQTPAGIHRKTIDTNDISNTLALAGTGKINSNVQEIYGEEDDLDQFTTTTNKKNKMRGLLRKVTRAFERTANIGSGDSDKETVRIANFEIALK